MKPSSSARVLAAGLSPCNWLEPGRKLLILERGPFLPQEKLNWDTSAFFLDNRYHTKETWQDKDGKDLHPQQSYFVGGQTRADVELQRLTVLGQSATVFKCWAIPAVEYD
jgi:hypothetical protein